MKSSTPKPLTKRLQTLIAVLGLAALGTGAANANDLINPDLDNISVGPQVNASPDSWQIKAYQTFGGPFNDGADSEPWCNVQQPGGYGLFFKPFQGSTNLVNDLLDVNFYQDNPSTAGAKCTLSGYAAGEANFCAFLPPPPGAAQAQALFVVQFLDNNNNVITSNAFDLVTAGLPAGGPGSMAQFTTPQYTAPVGTVAVRVGATMLNAYGTTGAQSFFVDAFDLEQILPPGSPDITNQPAATTAPLGGTATFSVGISNPSGATYQWQREGVDLTNSASISGATNATLVITGASTSNVGHYRVKVTNNIGTVTSQTVPLALDAFNFYPVIAIYGNIGSTYQVNYTTSLTPPVTWLPLSTVKLTSSPQYVIDSTSAGSNTRFYQVVFAH